VFWTADRTLGQWRRLLFGGRVTARLEPEGARGGRLLATTRIWSDGAYEAKLYDVVNARDLMGQGIAPALVTWALKHPAVGDVQRFVLQTRDADRLYERYGFQDPCAPDGRGLGGA